MLSYVKYAQEQVYNSSSIVFSELYVIFPRAFMPIYYKSFLIKFPHLFSCRNALDIVHAFDVGAWIVETCKWVTEAAHHSEASSHLASYGVGNSFALSPRYTR